MTDGGDFSALSELGPSTALHQPIRSDSNDSNFVNGLNCK